MKRFILYLLVLIPILSLAQTQSGYVRTAGKPNQKGQPLGGVSIKVSGNFNAVKSDETKGTFAIPMKDYKDGTAFVLQNVYKSGYDLSDKDFLSRKHPFSSQVPLEIVMISRADIIRVQTEIEDRARANAEKKYHAQLKELNEQLETHKISDERYRKELADLQKKQESFDALIAIMAEQYARTDYDKLDSLNKIINVCIVEGDLEKADSLIDSKGNIEQRVVACLEQEKVLEKAEDELRKAEAQIQQNKERAVQQKEDIAQDLYNKHSIALSHFEIDSAAYYIELRAELDTTNLVYQHQAAEFLYEYKANYQKSMYYLFPTIAKLRKKAIL